LVACVEIMLAVNDVAAARAAADELLDIASELDAPSLHAASVHSTGAVLLAEGEARTANDALRRAWAAWRELEVPYEAARVRVLIGRACQVLGDEDSAEMEWDAARWVFQQLGAVPDLARVDELSRKARPKAGGLTGREVEVLALAATGKTNHEIATALVISEHTIRRHLQNIFAKLGVSSRAAATAYAFQHDLI
jgi:ATP/maltotriose-dependent transcriptional regulator MalT